MQASLCDRQVRRVESEPQRLAASTPRKRESAFHNPGRDTVARLCQLPFQERLREDCHLEGPGKRNSRLEDCGYWSTASFRQTLSAVELPAENEDWRALCSSS